MKSNTLNFKCPFCSSQFSESELNALDKKTLQNGIDKQLGFVGLTCRTCDGYFGYNCKDRLVIGYENKESETFEVACPSVGCSGLVTKISEGLGCGECGEFWPSSSELGSAIDSIIDSFPYRTTCYKISETGYVSSGNYPTNYESLLAAEEDFGEDFS